MLGIVYLLFSLIWHWRVILSYHSQHTRFQSLFFFFGGGDLGSGSTRGWCCSSACTWARWHCDWDAPCACTYTMACDSVWVNTQNELCSLEAGIVGPILAIVCCILGGAVRVLGTRALLWRGECMCIPSTEPISQMSILRWAVWFWIFSRSLACMLTWLYLLCSEVSVGKLW